MPLLNLADALAVGSSAADAAYLGSTLVWPINQAPTTYREAVLAFNPIIYCPLDESSGTTAEDISGNNLDGDTTGATVNQTGFVPGDDGTCYDFDGSYDKILWDHGTTAQNSAEFTVELSVKLDSTSRFVISRWEKLNPYPGTWAFDTWHTGGKPRWYVTDTDNIGVHANSPDALSTGTAYLITGTFAADKKARLYVNGVLKATSTAMSGSVRNAVADTSKQVIELGTREGGYYYDGKAAHFAYFTTAHTDQEIADRYDLWAAT